MRLKWDDKGIKTPLAKARGLGSAKEGTGHWLNQRVTALANIPLMLWLLCAMTQMPDFTYENFTDWLAMPVNAVLMILAVISIFYHAALGTQVIAEDYIHCEGLKMLKLIGLKLFFIGGAVACIFSVLYVALGQ